MEESVLPYPTPVSLHVRSIRLVQPARVMYCFHLVEVKITDSMWVDKIFQCCILKNFVSSVLMCTKTKLLH
jgi:hypothetical protein